jgi:glycerol-3-phosphate acyltransferase PlsY
VDEIIARHSFENNAMTLDGKDLIWVLAAYFIGCLTAGYYWVRWRTGEDVRRLGSGHVGARNVGRRLGTSGFSVTFGLDFLKGLLAVAGATAVGLEREGVTAILFAVIIGHNWPVQLRFQGGKGIAVSLGALLAYDPPLLLILVVVFVPLWLWARNLTVAGMLAYAISPLVAFLCDLGPLAAFAMSGTAMLVVFAHRKNLREELMKMVPASPPSRDGDRPRGRSTL